MDSRAKQFDWNHARAFLVTAEKGSLSAACRTLGISQPTLGRQVTALEKELGVALFERGGHGLKLTPGGLELLEHVKTMAVAASSLSIGASGRSHALAGPVSISTSELMAAFLLPPLLKSLRLKHPHIRAEIIASDVISDLKGREADIALRFHVGRPADSSLIARKLGSVQGHLYATPEYLARLGKPLTVAALNRADFIGPKECDLHVRMLNERGLEVSHENFRVCVQSSLVQWEFTKNGLGIGAVPQMLGDHEPRVRRVMPELAPFRAEMWLVAHRELHMSRRIRTVFDFLARELDKAKDSKSARVSRKGMPRG